MSVILPILAGACWVSVIISVWALRGTAFVLFLFALGAIN